MDPVNPFNNLLSGRCGYGYGKINSQSENIKEFMSFMKNAAKLSLDIMNRSSDHMNIFRPHPLLHQLPKNDRWIIPSIMLIYKTHRINWSIQCRVSYFGIKIKVTGR